MRKLNRQSRSQVNQQLRLNTSAAPSLDPNFLLDSVVIDAVNRRQYDYLREKFTYEGVKSVLNRHADRITPHLTIR